MLLVILGLLALIPQGGFKIFATIFFLVATFWGQDGVKSLVSFGTFSSHKKLF